MNPNYPQQPPVARPLSSPFGNAPATTAAAAPPTAAAPTSYGGAAAPMYSQNPQAPAPPGPVAPTPLEPRQEGKLTDFNPLCQAMMRPTVTQFPSSQSMKQKLAIPLGFVCQPLYQSVPGEPEVPLINFGSVGTLVRCKRCRTYINPFVHWESNGRRWVCNVCGYVNETPNFYYCPLDETGRRADRFERKELCQGSVEYVAPGEYMVRPPQPPAYMFVIDVTVSAVRSGMLDCVVEAIKSVLEQDKLQGGTRTQIGFITFDSSVHFYKLSATMSQPRMLVVSDINDLFLPAPEDILVGAADCDKVITCLLNSLPGMFAETRNNDAALGAALQAAQMVMRHIGGKMLVFSSVIPTVGSLALKPGRDNPRLLNTEREVELLKPADETYKSLAVELTKFQISVELFCCPQTYTDIASMAPLCKYTGGDLRFFPQFNSQQSGQKLKEEIRYVLTRVMGWESVMRVRVSKGWRITNFYGHLFIRGMDLLVIPNYHEDLPFTFVVEMEDNVATDPNIYIQCALLFTSSQGERRIRVHSMMLPVTQHFDDFARSVDPQASACLMCSLAMEQSLKTKLADARDWLQTTCGQTLNAMSGIDCPAASTLPLYILGMLKTVAFRATSDVPSDFRAFHFSRLEALPVYMQANYFYPRLLPLHDLKDDEGETQANGDTPMPQQLMLTNQELRSDGAYLLEDGDVMLLWLGTAIQSSWIERVFGVPNMEQLRSDIAERLIGNTADPMSRRVAAIIEQARKDRTPFMKLLVIRQSEPLEQRFFATLYEDRTFGLQMSKQDFLTKFGPHRLANPAAQNPSPTQPAIMGGMAMAGMGMAGMGMATAPQGQGNYQQQAQGAYQQPANAANAGYRPPQQTPGATVPSGYAVPRH